MKKDEQISEEQLNAFIDGELDSEEKSSLFNEAEKSAELDQRLCQQRKLKDLIKHAYREVPKANRRLPGTRARRGILGMALAAGMLLVVGLTSGALIHRQMDQALPTTTMAAPAENYILHVTSGGAEQMMMALQKAKTLLAATEPGHPRRIEVIANDRGLDLLRSDVTLFSAEISALADRDVVFYACSKAIQRLEEQGTKVQLVPEAIPGYTALDRVVTRMQDGWEYVKL